MNNTLNQPLNKEDLQSLAPSIFTNTPSKKVSSKYTFISTERVVDDLNVLGWKPFQASQRKSRTKEDSLFTKHLVRLRNNTIGKIGDSIPEVVLTNSHDGRNAFSLHAGLFRLVCSNGLVVADTTFEQVKIKHQWYSFDEIQRVTSSMIEKVPSLVKHMSALDRIELSLEDQVMFGKKAMKCRWKAGNEKLDVEDLLEAVRVADSGNSLWKVFNTVQEKLIKGGLVYNNQKEKYQKLRPIVNIDQQININKNLWALTEEYL
jgi:hypothetical protein|tara:strand:+ start:2260 stop:3042 length:783 start_codon:yes stop_codon:yes gene_type:complete